MKPSLTFLLAITFLFLFSSSSVAFADDFQDAKDAYERKDYKTAHKLFLTLAEQGNANAQYNLGVMYDNGQGVPIDDKEAVKWYRLAAEQGDDLAQNNLGLMYYYGRGIPQDFALAHMWLNIAGSNGDKDAVKNKNKLEKKNDTATNRKSTRNGKELET